MTNAFSLSTHVLNLQTGRPAEGLTVQLLNEDGEEITTATTNADGRITDFSPLTPAVYELCFVTGDWFAKSSSDCFYPEVRVRFLIDGSQSHYHVPLLLNRYGYSTYRGS